MNYIFLILIFVFSATADTNTTNLNITRVDVQDSSLGEVYYVKENVSDCISRIPDIETVYADFSSRPMFVKGINGEDNNGWVKKYKATIQIPFMIKRKELIVITTKTINGKDPSFTELKREYHRVQVIESDSNNGDMFAGRSHREYFFSTKEAAIADVKNKAKTWLVHLSVVMCRE